MIQNKHKFKTIRQRHTFGLCILDKFNRMHIALAAQKVMLPHSGEWCVTVVVPMSSVVWPCEVLLWAERMYDISWFTYNFTFSFWDSSTFHLELSYSKSNKCLRKLCIGVPFPGFRLQDPNLNLHSLKHRKGDPNFRHLPISSDAIIPQMP